jgi:hypothetical protein
VAAQIVLANTGTKAWTSDTKLGTTVARDRASIFAGSDWPAPNRAAAITGTVAPGANGTFAFSFTGPTGAACVPGTYQEHFGVVQEGTTWFSDAGAGGPADDQIEALIQLLPGDAPTPPPPGVDAGTGATDDPPTGDDGASKPGGCDAGRGASGAGTIFLAALALRRRRR